MNRPNRNLRPAAGNLSRRQMLRSTSLRGAGLALGLPLLEAMTPAANSVFASNETASPVRMACIFFPNGAIMPRWKPEGQGTDWKLSETLSPLQNFKSKLNVISGLAHNHGRANGDGAGDHARCGATYLTAARPRKTSSNIQLGASVDQTAAAQLGNRTRLPSIELGLNGSRNAGSCDSGYSCAYSSNISWRNESQPMPKETSPRAAFDRMFGSGDLTHRREQNSTRKSIMDVVLADARRLQKKVGLTDQRKLDEYFNSVREIELQIARTESEDQAAMPDLDIPDGRIDAFRDHARLMFDIMALGFQNDTTRIATMMLDTAGGSRSYPEIGVKDSHHGISHHRDHKEKVDKLAKIDHYLVEQYAYFLDKLDSIPDGQGTLLDQSMIMYGSGISDGNRHDHGDLPVVMAGGAGGQIPTGRYIKTEDEVPMANLFVRMLQIMGTEDTEFGDSTGTFQLS